MSVAELLRSAQFVVDAAGERKAVQLDLAVWEEIMTLLKTQEAEWRRPFNAVRSAWDMSEQSPDEANLPGDEELVAIVHEARAELAASRKQGSQ